MQHSLTFVYNNTVGRRGARHIPLLLQRILKVHCCATKVRLSSKNLCKGSIIGAAFDWGQSYDLSPISYYPLKQSSRAPRLDLLSLGLDWVLRLLNRPYLSLSVPICPYL